MAFAEHAFRLAQCDDKGVSVERVLRQVEKTTGRRHPLLEMPELPEAVEHIWGWFSEIASRRTGNGYGPNPITWHDIQAWSQLTQTNALPWEVRMLCSLDRAWLQTHATKPKPPEN